MEGRDNVSTSQSPHIGQAVTDGAVLGISCFVSYLLITRILGRAYFLSRDDELLGGMWAVASTVFVYRQSYQQSVNAALSRVSATFVSFALCLLYLLIFPFHPWGMAALIGIGAVVMTLLDRSEDIITTGITTTVVMVVAGISPQHAWKNPILRLIDTGVGIVIGIAAAWIGRRITRSRTPFSQPPPSTHPASTHVIASDGPVGRNIYR
jgi:Fusaric acid resistance protein-like